MATKPETLARCRDAFDILSILLDRTPTQREVCRAAPASSSTVAALWDDLTVDDIDDDPRPPQVAATRSCLGCRRSFDSRSAGHRVCQRCKGLDSWQSGVMDFSATLAF
jgi:hypothetical protein